MDEAVAAFVCRYNPGMDMGDTPYSAIGNVDELGNLIGGVVLNNFTRRDIHLHVAGVGPRWCTRRFVGEVFRYVFLQLGCRRCTGLVAVSNAAARRFDEHLGFRREGVLRAYLEHDEDCLVYGMLREECRWLNVGVTHGKLLSTGHANALPARRRDAAAAALARAERREPAERILVPLERR
jgi:RimJ/RimL family protein N-acetyltransferase